MENKNIQTEFNIFEITKKLIGHTNIACESNYDQDSWENLELVHDLLSQWVYKLVVDIEKYHDAPQASAKRIVARQKSILSEVRDYIRDVEHGFIMDEDGNFDDMRHNAIESKLANIIIADCDYVEDDKKYFTWDEAMAIEKKLNNGWRLPTRSEWTLICEEFGQKDGELDADTLIKNLGIGRHGYLNGSLNNSGYNGRYWSSTVYNADQAYYLNFDSGVNPSNYFNRYRGFSVRLVKDIKE